VEATQTVLQGGMKHSRREQKSENKRSRRKSVSPIFFSEQQKNPPKTIDKITGYGYNNTRL
jgi:hypothetical protein